MNLVTVCSSSVLLVDIVVSASRHCFSQFFVAMFEQCTCMCFVPKCARRGSGYDLVACLKHYNKVVLCLSCETELRLGYDGRWSVTFAWICSSIVVN